jgi:Smg protein
LEHSGVIDPEAREMVIDRIMALEEVDLDLDHVKWIVMLVLSSRADQGEDTLLVEELTVDYLPGSLH